PNRWPGGRSRPSPASPDAARTGTSWLLSPRLSLPVLSIRPFARRAPPAGNDCLPPKGTRRVSAPRGGACLSAAQAQALDQRLVAGRVLPLQVGQQGTTLVDQLQQSATGVVVLLVHLEVLGQLLDAG